MLNLSVSRAGVHGGFPCFFRSWQLSGTDVFPTSLTMKTHPFPASPHRLVLLTLLFLSTINQPLSAFAQGTAFSYQGRLTDGANTASGSYDFRFTVFGDPVAPIQVGLPRTNNAVPVTNGLFTTILDFGQGWDNQPRWMEIAVKPGGSTNDFVALSPRQLVGAAPRSVYALAAGQYSGPIDNSQLPNVVARLNASQSVTGPWSFDPQAGNPPFSVSSPVLVTNLNADMLDGLRSSAFWKLGGNAGTTGGSDFLGTTDNQALEFKVNGTRALRLQPSSFGTVNSIGGSQNNLVAQVLMGVTIGGGGTTNWFGNSAPNVVGGHGNFATIAGWLGNTCDGDTGTIGGGENNTASAMGGATVAGGYLNSSAGNYSTVGGGAGNRIIGSSSTVAGGNGNMISRNYSTVGGGAQNTNTADYATVGGGLLNTISGFYSTVSGGRQNSSTRQYATVGGGYQNTNDGDYATVSGGFSNISSAAYATVGGGYGNSSGFYATAGGGENNSSSGFHATIGGGQGNASSGGYATIPGGLGNTASGQYSFAAGRQAKALHSGTFVWADSPGVDFSSTAANQFLIRAAGGVGIGLNNPAAHLHLYSTDNPTTFRIQSPGTPGFGRIEFVSNPRGDTFEWRPGYIQSTDNGGFTGGLGFFVNGTGSGNTFGNMEVMRIVNGKVGIGTNDPQESLVVVGNIRVTGTINPASDRNVKRDFAPVDSRAVLEKVAALPILTWAYKLDPATRHLGPVAQDFKAAFGLGSDDKSISTVDADGVALAAIQGLNQKLEAENLELRRELHELKAMVQSLAANRTLNAPNE